MTHSYTSVQHGQRAALLFASLMTISFFTASFAYADSGISLPGVNVQIAADGDVNVSGAKVTSVTNSTVNAETKWGSSILGWIIATDADTKFSAAKGGEKGIANIAIGDIVSFRGSLESTGASMKVQADQVKDWSHAEAKAKLRGVVTSINTTLNSFVITNASGTTTVQTSSTTSFKKNGAVASFADVLLNAKVKIAGYFNGSVFTATDVKISDDQSAAEANNDSKHSLRAWLRGHAEARHND